jgi:SecD/SecF fusion protein
MIVIYVWFRFENLAFGMGAVVALVHDVLVCVVALPVASYLSGNPLGQLLMFEDFKINLTIVAAVLTVVGYSINDTIVIFDRIREYLSGRKNAPIEGTINDALNSTLGRSINTSMTVLLTLLVMFIFGSDDIRGFCFAMIIGVISGVYSTLFIASPIVVDMRNWANKKAEA